VSSTRGLLPLWITLVLTVALLIWLSHDWMGRDTEPVLIDGDVVDRLTPGQMANIDLVLTNPHEAPLAVSDVRVVLDDVRAPHADERRSCTRADFTVVQSRDLDVVLPGNTTQSLTRLSVPVSSWPRIGMRERQRNQDGCKNASLTLSFSATGTPDE
jgi:hypothetical protein